MSDITAQSLSVLIINLAAFLHLLREEETGGGRSRPLGREDFYFFRLRTRTGEHLARIFSYSAAVCYIIEFTLGKMTSGNTLNYGSISHWTLTTVRHGCESDYSQL